MDYYSEKLDKLRLQAAYENTDYQIYNPQIDIICNSENPKLDKFLMQFGKKSWSFLTAANPNSEIQATQLNGWNNANLEFDLATKGWLYTYSVSIGKGFKWPAEESFLVFDIPLENAIALGRKYNQNAILIGQLKEQAKLYWLD